MKVGPHWQNKLYNQLSASQTIDSSGFKKVARRQVIDLVRFLNIKKGQHILDVPCGTGRHMAEFAKKGLHITGVDINPELLRIAGKSLTKYKNSTHLIRGNMSSLKRFYKKFDVVTNLFTSIGYFDSDQKNENIIKELLKCLKPGGHLVIETTNGDYLMRNWSPNYWHRRGQKIIAEIRNFDSHTKYNEGIQCFLDLQTGNVSAHYHRLRIYRGAELVRLVRKLGVRNVKLYENFQSSPYKKTSSKRIVLIAQTALK